MRGAAAVAIAVLLCAACTSPEEAAGSRPTPVPEPAPAAGTRAEGTRAEGTGAAPEIAERPTTSASPTGDARATTPSPGAARAPGPSASARAGHRQELDYAARVPRLGEVPRRRDVGPDVIAMHPQDEAVADALRGRELDEATRGQPGPLVTVVARVDGSERRVWLMRHDGWWLVLDTDRAPGAG